MDGQTAEYKQHSTTTRYIALVAVLTAIYSVYGYAVGPLQPITQSLDLFFLLPVFFAVLVALTGKKWSSTLLATMIGILFLYPTAGVPFPPHITVSLIVNGLVFDLYLKQSKTSFYDTSKKRLVIAGSLGNLAMATAGSLVLAIFSPGALSTTFVGNFPLPYLIAFALISNTLVGAVGGFFGAIVIERVRGVQTRRALEARASMKVRA